MAYSSSAGSEVTAVVVGAVFALIGQGVVRNVRIFENVYMRQPPLEPALQDKRYRSREWIGKIVGWWFTAVGAVSLVAGLAALAGAIVRAA